MKSKVMKCPHKSPTPEQCFNCPFPDCVNDDLSLEEYKEDIIPPDVPRSVKMARIRANRYAEKHRNENRERSLRHYQENKDKYNAQKRKWNKQNKSRVATAKRERYQANLELYRQKQREYRARKKAEREKMNKC